MPNPSPAAVTPAMAGPNVPPPPSGFTIDAPAPPTPLVPDVSAPPEGYQPDITHPGAVKPIPGGPKDPNAPGNSLTPGALDDATSRLILTGQMDPMGMGGGPTRIAILNNRDAMLKRYNVTDQQLPFIRSQFDADTKAYSQRTQQTSFQKQALTAAQGHFNQIAGDLDNLPAQTSSTALNAVSNFAQGQFGGRTITDLEGEIPLFQAEIGKIMTANPSGSGNLTDAARQEFDILNSSRDPQARKEAMQKILQMAQTKVQADDTETTRLGKRLGGGLATYASIGAPGAGGTPPGTTPPGTTPNGTTTPPGTDPGIQNVGGFKDELTFNPAGAEQFHDALFKAAQGGQIKSIGDAQAWAANYNKQNGTDYGVQDSPVTEQAIAAAAAGKPFSVGIPQMSQTEAARLKDRLAINAKDNPKAASTAAGVADTGLLGSEKSVSAASDAVSDALHGNGFDYTGNLNADTNYIDALKQQHPGYYLGGQIAGGFALPMFGARTVPQFAKLGAAYGGAYGFNENPTQPLVNRAVSGVGGAIVGAAVPYGISALGRGLGAVRGAAGAALNYLPKAAEGAAPSIDPAAVAAAGQAEGVTVNRAMVDPSLGNKVSAVDRSMVGGPILQRGMSDVKGQIAGKVAALAPDGTPLEPVAAGNAVAGAADRYIKQSGADFRAKYGALNTAVSGTKYTPVQANLQVEQIIHDLSETPNVNANEISYLQGIHQDLSKGLSINALRGLRSKINSDLATGNLTFGADEARVKSIADAAATDIENGLDAAGKGDIAARFKQVDGDYRQRMQFINGTVQDLVGKRGSNLSGEQVFANLKSMTGPRGDSQGISDFLGKMTPGERADTQATLANALGSDNKGNFSTATLARQAQAMPQAMKISIFGKDGAESLSNLATLANAHNAVASKMSGSPTGVANDYRSWLNTILFGGGGELLTHNAGGAAAAAIGAAAIKGGRDVMNARMLLNKDVSNWLKNVPAGSVQKAADVHLARLNGIAARNPGIASDVMQLKQAIGAANDNLARTGSVAASPNGGPNQQQQPNGSTAPAVR